MPVRRANPLHKRAAIALPLAAGISLAALLAAAPMFDFNLRPATPAHAQATVSVEFRTALDPYGRWVNHPRWGEVWVPADVDRDWRPYLNGRWEYTDEWGWYWVSDEDHGWITYHYGRWLFDRELGWIWIPGEEWGPAWVQWRRGGEEVGWAPLPPDQVIAEYEDEPEVWVFVRQRDLVAPRIRTVILPRPQVVVFVRQTVVVNRTVYFTGRRRPAVNPGIPPMYIAAAIGRPIRPAIVRPPVLRGTVGVVGAIELSAERARRERVRIEVRQRETQIQPAQNIPPPRRLERNEPGRLGERPPSAARDAGPPAAPGFMAKDKDKGAPFAKDKDKGLPPFLTKEKDKGAPFAKDKDKGPPPFAKEKDKGPPPFARDKDKGPAPFAKDKDKGPPPFAKDKDRGAPPFAKDKGPAPLAKDKGPAPPHQGQGLRPGEG
jgi:hypothetical protein